MLVEAESFQRLGGRVVGRAAALCRRLQCDPRAIYDKHLGEFKALLTNPEFCRCRRGPASMHLDGPEL